MSDSEFGEGTHVPTHSGADPIASVTSEGGPCGDTGSGGRHWGLWESVYTQDHPRCARVAAKTGLRALRAHVALGHT